MMVMTCLLTLLVSTTVGSAAQKPVVRVPIKGDSFQPLQTLADLTLAADAVVVVRAIGKRDASIPRRARTAYTMRLVSTLKEHRALTSEVTVLRPIGRLEYEDRIVEQFEAEFPEFEVGSTYLLFLKWNENTRGFWLAGNAQGAALVHGDRCETFGKDPISRSLNGKDVASVRADVRSQPAK